MANNPDRPARPPRSLRDRSQVNLSNSELPLTDYINTEQKEPAIEKPDDFDEQSRSYLSQVDDEGKTEAEVIVDSPPAEDRPRVQVLNVREKRISTENIKRETRDKIKEEVEKAKEEFQKVEEAVEETKEELGKISDKIKADMEIYKAKIMAFGLKAIDALLTIPKDWFMSQIFRRKSKNGTQNDTKTAKVAKAKVIPKIKYASLLAKKIEFLGYDKKPLVSSSDTGILLEQIFISNTISDVQFCVKYVMDLPIPEKGIYSGRRITEIFENVTAEDINRFLYYVQNNPEPFVGSNFKFSEAFATWIIRKSHEL